MRSIDDIGVIKLTTAQMSQPDSKTFQRALLLSDAWVGRRIKDTHICVFQRINDSPQDKSTVFSVEGHLNGTMIAEYVSRGGTWRYCATSK